MGGNSKTVGCYDWRSTAATEAVIETVARASGEDPERMDPLYEYVDTDALNAMFDGNDSGISVSLTYTGHDVFLSSDGDVVVRRVVAE